MAALSILTSPIPRIRTEPPHPMEPTSALQAHTPNPHGARVLPGSVLGDRAMPA